jgi:hypothetical protein
VHFSKFLSLRSSPRHPRAAAAAYYASINFRTKLDFVHQAVVARLSQPDIPGKAGKAWVMKFADPLLPVWAALEKRLQKKAVKRNKIAHFEKMVFSGEWVLVPPTHNPLNFVKMATSIATGDQEGRIDAKKLTAIIEEFQDVYEAVLSFNKEFAKSIGAPDPQNGAHG